MDALDVIRIIRERRKWLLYEVDIVDSDEECGATRMRLPILNSRLNELNVMEDLFLNGVSSNGRTRDFESLYEGSNPSAPAK